MPDGGTSAFEVDEAALSTFASTLHDLGCDATTASGYVDTHLSITAWDAAMFAMVNNSVNDMRDIIMASLARLRELVDTSADELGRTAAHYRSTDDDARSALDAAYPG